ncbi:MAG: hypothetical protein DHS80DRAFT_24428 [Piptocephalis tieghemiana]|nr:MAG: hypothetical protein DHS80DRAFT_24428 [Piptocephalis tieghemiana]
MVNDLMSPSSLFRSPYLYLTLGALLVVWWKGWASPEGAWLLPFQYLWWRGWKWLFQSPLSSYLPAGSMSPIWYHVVDLLDWTFASPITLSFTLLSLLLFTAALSQHSTTGIARRIHPYIPEALREHAAWLVPILMMIWKAYETQRSQNPGWIPTLHRWIWGPSLSETWLAVALSAIPVILPSLLLVTSPRRKAIWWKPSTWQWGSSRPVVGLADPVYPGTHQAVTSPPS